MEFGCIGTGGVENNKDRPYECSVNECEQESACWCEYLVLDYQSIIYFCVFLIVQHQKLVYLLGMYIVHMILMKLES